MGIKMKHQGLNINQGRNFYFLFSGISALLIVSGGITLLSADVNANQERTNESLIAQNRASKNVIYVNPEIGSDTYGAETTEQVPCKTISFALSMAKSGTTIQLSPGNYSENTGEKFPLNIKSGITLLGDESTKGEAIIIAGSGNYISRTFARQNVTIVADNNSRTKTREIPYINYYYIK